MEKLSQEEKMLVARMLLRNGINVEALANLNLDINQFPLHVRKEMANILIQNGSDFSKIVSLEILDPNELTESEIAMMQGYNARKKFWGKSHSNPQIGKEDR